MKILFVGDVMGRPGREALTAGLARLRAGERLDAIVVNGENAARGLGITEAICAEFIALGADVITTGNHVWDQREALEFIGRTPRLLRPHNAPPGTPGTGWRIFETAAGVKVGVLCLLGRVFMQPTYDCPFRCADAALADKPGDCQVVVVDMHAEATSEKMAMGWYLDGRVSAVIGTHTHVPTADARVLPGGTGYISDAGMTGCYDSVIGMEKAGAIRRFLTSLPERLDTAAGPATFCGVLLDVDEDNGSCRSITPITF